MTEMLTERPSVLPGPQSNAAHAAKPEAQWLVLAYLAADNNLEGEFMTFSTAFKSCAAAACIIAFSGCTDLKPIQAQIDDLKAQVAKLQSDTAKAESDAQAAMSAAQGASSAAAAAQGTANQALSTAQQNSAAISSINEKIDRMFKKSVSK